jgi:peptide chain release factor
MSQRAALDNEQELKARMRRLNVSEGDIQESFLRASKKGGQNVNKVATCVYLHHAPTGLSVKCQEERQQGLNRYRARVLLLDKIEELQDRQKRAIIDREEKDRRRRRKRTQNAKEAMLDDKRRRKERKQIRRRISVQKIKDYL